MTPLEPAQISLHDVDGCVVAVALVDWADIEVLSAWRWSVRRTASGDLHAYRKVRENGRQFSVYLARQLLGLERGDAREADHKNGNGLDNRRENLRVLTHGENAQNRRGAQRNSQSGVRGVNWCGYTGRWKAQAVLEGRQHFLGRFDTVEEARVVVEEWRREHMPLSIAS